MKLLPNVFVKKIFQTRKQIPLTKSGVKKTGCILTSLTLIIMVTGYLYSNRSSSNPVEKTPELYNLKNSLVQNRILMIQMLSIDTENVLELNDILNLNALESQKTKEMANNIKSKQKYSEYKKLIVKSEELAAKIETNAKNAMEKKTGSRKETINLLVELTNLILEWGQKLPNQ